MKLRCEFEIVTMDEEICAVPVGDSSDVFRGVLMLNETAAKMLRSIAECATPEEALDKLMTEYPDEDKNDIAQKLCDFLNKLTREGLLVP